MTVTIDSATIGIHQPTEPKRDFPDFVDDRARAVIFPAGFARFVRGFFFLLNVSTLAIDM
jgi:hypothetical protein